MRTLLDNTQQPPTVSLRREGLEKRRMYGVGLGVEAFERVGGQRVRNEGVDIE